MQDSLGNTVTTASAEALRLIESAIDLHARGWPGALETAEAAANEDPALAIAHALQALIHGMWGRRPLAEAAMSRALPLARHASPIRSANCTSPWWLLHCGIEMLSRIAASAWRTLW